MTLHCYSTLGTWSPLLRCVWFVSGFVGAIGTIVIVALLLLVLRSILSATVTVSVIVTIVVVAAHDT